jgi:hypothetical protein
VGCHPLVPLDDRAYHPYRGYRPGGRCVGNRHMIVLIVAGVVIGVIAGIVGAVVYFDHKWFQQ